MDMKRKVNMCIFHNSNDDGNIEVGRTKIIIKSNKFHPTKIKFNLESI
jgi:hypothetical protein